MDNETITKLAEAVKEAGGRAMFVGGFVRDSLMGIPSKDEDIEVYNLEQEKLEEILSRFGAVNEVGKSFAVYKIGQDIDVSLPRREKKIGTGHKAFKVVVDPFMSFEDALERRDFTINATLADVLTGEIVDPFRGREAIKNRTLRMVSPKTFQEDSLRVLRLAQFASRFGFGIEAETRVFAQKTDLSDLPKERIWMELEKLLLKSPKPSVGILELQNLHITEKLFPSLKHYARLLEAIDAVCINLGGFAREEKLAVVLSVLCFFSEELSVLDEMGMMETKVRDLVVGIKDVTMVALMGGVNTYRLHKLSAIAPLNLCVEVLFALGAVEEAQEIETTGRQLGIMEKPVEPILKGRHLIELGVQPSPEFGKILDLVYDLQLRGEVTSLDHAKDLALCTA